MLNSGTTRHIYTFTINYFLRSAYIQTYTYQECWKKKATTSF